ncbi:MAG: flagellar basal body rod protein FlgC [Myxococcales bacterium]|nr:flagellar basal body rod protein FlgC [Myxococcales bacterium]
MKFSHITDIAASGLAAQRARMAASASNLANVHTTRGADGEAYRRRDPVFAAEPMQGRFGSTLERAVQRVTVQGVELDTRDPILRHDPGHPDANEEGMVAFPRISTVDELANVLSASRSYEANLVIVRKVREMADAAMQIGR